MEPAEAIDQNNELSDIVEPTAREIALLGRTNYSNAERKAAAVLTAVLAAGTVGGVGGMVSPEVAAAEEFSSASRTASSRTILDAMLKQECSLSGAPIPDNGVLRHDVDEFYADPTGSYGPVPELDVTQQLIVNSASMGKVNYAELRTFWDNLKGDDLARVIPLTQKVLLPYLMEMSSVGTYGVVTLPSPYRGEKKQLLQMKILWAGTQDEVENYDIKDMRAAMIHPFMKGVKKRVIDPEGLQRKLRKAVKKGTLDLNKPNGDPLKVPVLPKAFKKLGKKIKRAPYHTLDEVVSILGFESPDELRPVSGFYAFNNRADYYATAIHVDDKGVIDGVLITYSPTRLVEGAAGHETGWHGFSLAHPGWEGASRSNSYGQIGYSDMDRLFINQILRVLTGTKFTKNSVIHPEVEFNQAQAFSATTASSIKSSYALIVHDPETGDHETVVIPDYLVLESEKLIKEGKLDPEKSFRVSVVMDKMYSGLQRKNLQYEAN